MTAFKDERIRGMSRDQLLATLRTEKSRTTQQLIKWKRERSALNEQIEKAERRLLDIEKSEDAL